MSGVRYIGGREYLLCGRFSTPERAKDEAGALRARWEMVRVLKTHYTWTCWVHGLMKAEGV